MSEKRRERILRAYISEKVQYPTLQTRLVFPFLPLSNGCQCIEIPEHIGQEKSHQANDDCTHKNTNDSYALSV